jgi:hypothetical protein
VIQQLTDISTKALPPEYSDGSEHNVQMTRRNSPGKQKTKTLEKDVDTIRPVPGENDHDKPISRSVSLLHLLLSSGFNSYIGGHPRSCK